MDLATHGLSAGAAEGDTSCLKAADNFEYIYSGVHVSPGVRPTENVRSSILRDCQISYSKGNKQRDRKWKKRNDKTSPSDCSSLYPRVNARRGQKDRRTGTIYSQIESNRFASIRHDLVFRIFMHNAREGSARNELDLYLVRRYEYQGTVCRPGPHRLCGRRKVYRSVDVGLSMLRGRVLRPRRELGKTRRTIRRERKTVRWKTWTDDNSRVGDRDWQYVRVFCEGTAIAKRAIHAGSTDRSALTRSEPIISGRGDSTDAQDSDYSGSR